MGRFGVGRVFALAAWAACAKDDRLCAPVLGDAAFAAYDTVYEEIRRADLAADQGFVACDSHETFAQRQAEVRRKWFDALGGFPGRTPLKPAAGETIRRDGHTVTKIRFESQPGLFVTALLYRPADPAVKPPYPALLIPCGHSANGKAYPAYQRAALLAARAGFVALCYDPIDQGERIQLSGPGAPVSVDAHNRAGVRAVLLGWNLARFRIWDGIRAIDYLTSLPEVDPGRIGVLGNSGGGTLTSYIMNADERVKTAAPACYITALRDLCARSGPHDAEQNTFGQLAFGLNHAALLVLRAPHLSVCVNAAHDDFFPIGGTRASVETACRAYGRLGHTAIPISAPKADTPLALIDVPGPHGWKEGMMRGSLQWMRAKLAGDKTALPYDIGLLRTLSETPDSSRLDYGLPEKETWVTPTGAVRDLPGNRTVYALLRDELERLDALRKPESRTDLRAKVSAALNLDRVPVTDPAVSVITETAHDDHTETRLAVRVTTGFAVSHTVPAILFRPRTVRASPVLIVTDEGRAGAAVPMRRYLDEGAPVMVADLFGTGETGGLKAGHYNFGGTNTNESVAMMLYLLGRSAVEFRVRELLACAGELSRRCGGNPVRAHACGTMVIPACHAAVIADDCFTGVTGEAEPLSWREAIRTTGPYPFSNCVQGGLRQYDWTDLYALVCTRARATKAK